MILCRTLFLVTLCFALIYEHTSYADEAASKPSVFYSCRINDIKDEATPNDISCDSIVLQIVSKLDQEFSLANTIDQSNIVFTVDRISVGQEHRYSLIGAVRNEEHTQYGPITITIDSGIDSITHMNLLLDAMEKILIALKSTLPQTTGENSPTKNRLKNWYIEINANANHNSSGNKTSNTNVGLFTQATGIYGKNKIQALVASRYVRVKQPITSTDTFKGNSFGVTLASVASHSLGNHNEKGEKWSFAIITESTHNPYSMNLDFKQEISAGVEWNLVPYRTSADRKSVIIRAGVTGAYNDYHVQNILEKDWEIFPSAFANLIVAWYSKDDNYSIKSGLSADFRMDKPQFGTYKVNSDVMVKLFKKKVTVRTGFNVTYRPKSLTDQNPNIPAVGQAVYFYNGYAGISAGFNGGISVNIGKLANQQANDTRWKSF